MTIAENLSRLDRAVRPTLVAHLPPWLATWVYSATHDLFLDRLVRERPVSLPMPAKWSRVLWGLTFRNPLFNAAGLFKYGQGYELSYLQGAGAYLAGTVTADERAGNRRAGIRCPLLPYPRSRASSNWMGLPSAGYETLLRHIKTLPRYPGFPLGISIAASPSLPEAERTPRLVEGLQQFAAAGVDFIEMNESCPNTTETLSTDVLDAALLVRLDQVAEGFLSTRSGSRPPVIVKFSSDTAPDQVPALLAALRARGFDGVNFGNTSTRYDHCRSALSPEERRSFDYFAKSFGGGVSGAPIRPAVRALCAEASRWLRENQGREFHVIQTGGIDDPEHLREAETDGASLMQWYLGYFWRFGTEGHRLYASMLGAGLDGIGAAA